MTIDVSLWWFLGAAAALAGYWVVRVFGSSLDSRIFIRVLQKIIRENNLTRAIKLSSVVADAPLATATKAALLASVSREDDEKRPVGYRGGPRISMDAVRARIRARYDDAFAQSMAPIRRAFLLALPSPVLCVGTIVWILSHAEPDWKLVATAVSALLVLLYTGAAHLKIASSRNAGFESLWPTFESVFHDRHALRIDDKPIIAPAEARSVARPPIVETPRITLEILEPEKPLRSLALDEPVIKIGRLSSAHVKLSAEGVARMHAVIEITDGVATIIDLGATRTTRVNGATVTKWVLSNGDVIGIGDAEIVVRLGAGNNVTSS